MAKNPVPLIIPCHRVLAAGGKVGGFSAPGGAATKIHMLKLEGVKYRTATPGPAVLYILNPQRSARPNTSINSATLRR